MSIFVFFFQVLGLVTCRFVATHHVTKNIELIAQDPKDLQIKQDSKRSGDSSSPPLLVMLSWLLSKRKHLMKFANLYMEQGFDVVTVSVHPWQLMWPVKGTRVIIIYAFFMQFSIRYFKKQNSKNIPSILLVFSI